MRRKKLTWSMSAASCCGQEHRPGIPVIWRGAELWRAEERVAVFLRRCDEDDHLLAHFAVRSGTRMLEFSSNILSVNIRLAVR